MRRPLHRLLALFRSTRAESDLAREINAHLQMLEDEFVARGMRREDARYAAKRAFGGVEQVKELQRDERSFRWLAGWPMDLKLGARMLVRSPGLTAVGVIALAVAIGAGAAFLELSNDLLNPTLDIPGGERIVGVRVWNSERRRDETHLLKDFETWRASASLLEDLGGARPVNRDLRTADGRIEPARAVAISASAFRLVPARPALGRTLSDADEEPAAPPVAVIGHDLWRTRFNSDPNVLGSSARLGSMTYTIVGVMPDGFGFPVNQNLWVPLKTLDTVHQIFGGLKQGATVAAAEAELSSFAAGSRSVDRLAHVRVQPYLESELHETRGTVEVVIFRSIHLLFILLLGLCGANVATLVFARTAMREGEITVRTALGASRGRIAAQLFAEALVLSVIAAVAGLAAARFVSQWATRLYEQGIGRVPFWWDQGLGLGTIVYAFALAILAAAIIGLVPAMKATGRQLQGRLREAASGTSTMTFGGLWTGVIVTQTAVTVVCLSAVVSFGWTGLKKESGSDVTYSREHLLTARIDAAGVDADAGAPVYRRLAQRIAREPGVAGASYTTGMPGTIFEQFVFEFESPELQAHADARRLTDYLWCEGAAVGEDFFETAGLSIVSGRGFTPAEIRQGAAVAVVDETFVRTALAGRSPLGVTLRARDAQGAHRGQWLEIIGVVNDATIAERKGIDDAAVYRPVGSGVRMNLLVHTHGAAAAMTQRVYAAAQSVDPDVRLVGLRSLTQLSHDADMPQRIFLRAFMVIGAIALLLATAGIYALISFTLARRTREIGIRVALGAARRSIIGGVFSRAFVQVGLGVAAGALPGFYILMSGSDDAGAMNYAAGIGATIAVCVFVIAVALASCSVPLRRALRVDPIQALRTE